MLLIGDNCLRMLSDTRRLNKQQNQGKRSKCWDASRQKNLASGDSALTKTMRPNPIFFVPGRRIRRPRGPWLPNDLAMAFYHFRCLNHKLPIELGRFWGVERDDRNCELCRVNRLGYLFECSYFDEQRRLCLPRGLARHPNTVIFGKVMNNKDIQVLFKLSKFCNNILATFKVIHSNI